MSSYNLYGGTPKKTLDLMKYFKKQSILYVYHDDYSELKPRFEATRGSVYEGFYGRNIFLHLNKLLSIIDKENINIVQTQFSMGETLAFLIKLFRPKVKVVCAFVGALKPNYFKAKLLGIFYKKFDAFVYISKYVKQNKESQFSILKRKQGVIILNGSEKRVDIGEPIVQMSKISLLDIAGLVDYKNVRVLLDAMNILVNKRQIKNIFLYVAGDGPERQNLENLIIEHNLENNVNLLGYQKNVGGLLESCDIFVHPCYVEGFGIVIVEAMHACKPIIVSNAGALPELIENEVSGLVVEPHDAEQWADAILRIIENPKLAEKLARNGKQRATKEFSKEKYTNNYKNLYNSLLVK